jgi:hypothetical protein
VTTDKGPRHRAAQRRAERERQVGLEPDDEAARWLAEHEPRAPEPPPVSKSARKSKLLHQWRQRQRGS